MSFPQTRLTLIERLTSGGTEEDWQRFLKDYWGPICRFSLRFGARNLDDAEDVAAQTVEVLWEKKLLARWMSNRAAKLRSLLCAVVRNILSTRHRNEASRERKLRDLVERIDEANRASDAQLDGFYAAWVEDLVQRAVEAIAAEYSRKGQGDYVRVLYGRLCLRRTNADTAEVLKVSPSLVDYRYRSARDRLGEKLKELVRRHVHRYCSAEGAEQEFDAEWQQLGQYLAEHGGLEEAVRRAYDLLDPVRTKERKETGLTRAATRLTSIILASSDASGSSRTT